MTADNHHPFSWRDFSHGDVLAQHINSALSPWWPKVFGYHLLKLGHLARDLDSSSCRINHQITLAGEPGCGVIASCSDLPFKAATIDAAILPCLLEFETNPYRILREVDRVLISGGYLFIIGFNPLSPLFFGKMLPKYQRDFPWCGHFYLPSRVKDWLHLLGYQLVADERRLYHPLIGPLKEYSFWQDSLKSWLPGAGSIYVLVARKIDSPLTPIRNKQKVKRRQWSAATTASRLPRQKE
ncbi:class I SAM-dependent methyltransferase [Shewanella sp. SNU WT4]|uniref:methyltransferase domain-containing protein n=1 Tax=Shewanella sp. SNU WT4 TaxID=2590015 RepID=UPI00112A3137|nr:methyltransferase domain-containing protein [Shewanella sp. SNU WT4]QDF67195.1 class I SAM-dependent methyltransferase [Shewanella sp. SNU WT4]